MTDVDVDVTLQDRGGKEQRITLRTTLPGLSPLIAVAEGPDITRDLTAAKRDLIRQLEHQKSAREPMKNRRLRRPTIRRTAAAAPATSEIGRTSIPGIPTPTNHPRMRADSGTAMARISEPRVTGNHAEMGGTTPAAAAYVPSTVGEVLRAGVRRRERRKETAAAQSAWDSEGGAQQNT